MGAPGAAFLAWTLPWVWLYCSVRGLLPNEVHLCVSFEAKIAISLQYFFALMLSVRRNPGFIRNLDMLGKLRVQLQKLTA